MRDSWIATHKKHQLYFKKTLLQTNFKFKLLLFPFLPNFHFSSLQKNPNRFMHLLKMHNILLRNAYIYDSSSTSLILAWLYKVFYDHYNFLLVKNFRSKHDKLSN